MCLVEAIFETKQRSKTTDESTKNYILEGKAFDKNTYNEKRKVTIVTSLLFFSFLLDFLG